MITIFVLLFWITLVMVWINLLVTVDKRLEKEALIQLERKLVNFCYAHGIPIVKMNPWHGKPEAAAQFEWSEKSNGRDKRPERILINMQYFDVAGHSYVPALYHEVGHYIDIFQKDCLKNEEIADYYGIAFACVNLGELHRAALQIRFGVENKRAFLTRCRINYFKLPFLYIMWKLGGKHEVHRSKG